MALSRSTTAAVVPLLLAAVAAAAGAQTVVTLAEARDAARSGNASVRAARLNTDAAAAEIPEARAGFFPRVTVAERWQRGNEPVFVFGSRLSSRQFTADGFALDALNHPDATGAFHTTVGVDQVIFDGGRTAAGLRAATLRRDIARFEADGLDAEMAVRVTRTYGRAIVARAAAAAAARALDAARTDLATVERRRDAGLASDADVLAIQVQATEFEQRQIEALGDYTSALAELRYLMGAPATRQFDVAEPVVRDDTVAPTAPETGASRRPDLLRAGAAVQLADAESRATRSALVPQIAAQSILDIAGTKFADRAPSWIVGGEVRWTFSTGGAELARRAAAAAARARADAERDDAVAQARMEIATAVEHVRAARARQRVGEAAVAQARESERIVRDRFAAGLANTSDLLRVAAAAFDAEQRRVSALADVLTRQAELERARGGGTEGAQR